MSQSVTQNVPLTVQKTTTNFYANPRDLPCGESDVLRIKKESHQSKEENLIKEAHDPSMEAVKTQEEQKEQGSLSLSQLTFREQMEANVAEARMKFADGPAKFDPIECEQQKLNDFARDAYKKLHIERIAKFTPSA